MTGQRVPGSHSVPAREPASAAASPCWRERWSSPRSCNSFDSNRRQGRGSQLRNGSYHCTPKEGCDSAYSAARILPLTPFAV